MRCSWLGCLPAKVTVHLSLASSPASSAAEKNAFGPAGRDTASKSVGRPPGPSSLPPAAPAARVARSPARGSSGRGHVKRAWLGGCAARGPLVPGTLPLGKIAKPPPWTPSSLGRIPAWKARRRFSARKGNRAGRSAGLERKSPAGQREAKAAARPKEGLPHCLGITRARPGSPHARREIGGLGRKGGQAGNGAQPSAGFVADSKGVLWADLPASQF